MKRIVILIMLFVNIIFVFSDNNFLLKKLPPNYHGFKTFDYFLIEKKISDSGEYTRNHNITRYKAAFYIYEIYRNGLRKNIDFIPVYLESYETMISDLNLELVFLYGEKIIATINSEINEYRKKKGIIKHRYVNEEDNSVNKTVLINTDTQKNRITSGTLGVEYKYSSGLDVDIFSASYKEKDYSSYMNTVVNIGFESFSTNSSVLWNDDYIQQNSKVRLKIFKKFRDFYFFNHNDRKNSLLSYSGYYFENTKHFRVLDLDINIKNFTHKNKSENIDYFYTEWRKKGTLINISSEISRGVSGILYNTHKKDYQKNSLFDEELIEYKGYLEKQISGQYIDGMRFKVIAGKKEYNNDSDKRKKSDIEYYNVKITLPYDISYYTIDIGNYRRDVFSEDIDHVDADMSDFRLSRIWFNRLRSDIVLAYNYKDYNAHDNVSDGFNADSYDYSKKYWEISFSHYFDVLNSIDISLFTGTENNPVNTILFPNFDFVYRSLDIHFGDFVIEYSTLQKSHTSHKGLNSKLFNLGVFYEFYW